MEDYSASSEYPLDKCLQDISDSEIYIGIFAYRYGYIPKDKGYYDKSITELEYLHAVKTKKEILIFLVHEDIPWLPKFIDKDLSNIERLKKELEKNTIVDYFKSEDHLASIVSSAVSKIVPKLTKGKSNKGIEGKNYEPDNYVLKLKESYLNYIG